MEYPRHSERLSFPLRQSCQDPADNDYCEIISNAEFRNEPMRPAHNAPIDKENRESKQKTSISFLTRNYKQSLIGIIGGSLLTLLIALPAVYFSTKSSLSTDVKDNYLPLKFDKSTLHPSAFISEDGLKLSLTYSRDTPVSSVKNPNTLSNYKGVIGDICIGKKRKIYFEVQYEFSDIDNYDAAKIIFEVGLAERERVDNSFYVGNSRTGGWSYNLYFCRDRNNSVCLAGEHNGNEVINELHLQQTNLKSKHSGTFGFIVNTSQETFSIIQNSTKGTLIIHSLQNVFSIHRLCPVFAVYFHQAFEVKLTLLNTYDFSEAIWNIVMI